MENVYQRVVLVDDEAIHIKIHKLHIRRCFGRQPIEIVSFTNPVQALLYLQEENAGRINTLVLLDLHMPFVDGWDFLDHLNHVDMAVTHVYIATSSIRKEDIEKAHSHPKVSGYLIKPIDLAIEKLLTATLAASHRNQPEP